MHRAEAAFADRLDIGIDDALQVLQAAQLHVVRGIVVQPGGGCSWPGAEDEAEAVVKMDVVNELHHFVEVFFRLTGKAHDEIAAHGQIRTDGAQLAHRAFVFHGGVAAFHGHQDAVRAVLHG
ncbi:hypothetical protein D3C71_1869140 [compost metagenome]